MGKSNLLLDFIWEEFMDFVEDLVQKLVNTAKYVSKRTFLHQKLLSSFELRPTSLIC